MNILIAPDKFKGSLTAHQACDAIASGIIVQYPTWEIVKSPLADGGEGTSEILTSIGRGKKIKCKARDPLFREIEVGYGLSLDGLTAFIEMASASGLQLLNQNERNPMLTSSIGTGDLIVDALARGVSTIILGCGGSATNDGGIGMAQALGILFRDNSGNELTPVGGNLSKIESYDAYGMRPEIQNCKFILLSDVDNPLTGLHGASFVYAKQKGASDQDISKLDDGLIRFARILERIHPGITDFPGAGAAGGFPVSAKAFLKADIKSGIGFIIEFSGIEEKVKRADLVITGEGKFDQQSLHGKVIEGLSTICKKYGRPLWVVCGVSEVSDFDKQKLGIDKVIALVTDETDRETAIQHAAERITKKIKENI